VELDSLDQVAKEVIVCRLCPLSESRRNAVPGEGSPHAKVMIVGEAPGYNEDLQGRPFVGSAGQLLNELLESIGVKRESVFITNIVKCRPPENRPPRISERKACRPYLSRQLSLVGPAIVCPMGNAALSSLVGQRSIGESHGRSIEEEGIVYLPLYHPAAALYDNSLKGVLFEDFKALGTLMNARDRRG
jgi:uracil-DNA glycosylase family 4